MRFVKGLENVIALQSKISSIDANVLRYRGININELVKYSSYEEVVCLLMDGTLPSKSRITAVKRTLKKNRTLPASVRSFIMNAPTYASPMAVLRTALCLVSISEKNAEDLSAEHEEQIALRIMAVLPTIVACQGRRAMKKSFVRPKKDLAHAANFLYMLTGTKPSKKEATMMDAWFILHADHTLNASTFTGRVIASTLSDMYSGVIGAIGALKGPLHGGANQKVMEMLKKIKNIAHTEKYILNKLENHEKIMGIGHRVYKKGDPRALHLSQMSKTIGEMRGEPQWYAISEQIAHIVKERIGLLPNVDFYSASFLYTIGVPISLFPCLFAVSRSAGWTAHIMEQHANNRLIRPKIQYIGPKKKTYVPLSRR